MDPRQNRSTMPPQQTTNDNRISPVVAKPLVLASSSEQTFSVVNRRPPSPLGGNLSSYPPQIPRTTIITAASLIRAPKVSSNYMVHSSDRQSTDTYGHHNITIMQMTSRESGSQGNRWYANDFQDTNGQPTKFAYH